MAQSPDDASSPSKSNSKLHLPPSCNPPSSSNPPKQKAWIVFGGSGHMGRSVVKAALNHGDLVSAVGKTLEDTAESMRPSILEHPATNYQGLLCDVRVLATVADAIQRAIANWGRIDIIANCSGYGVIGACEDQDEYDIRNQFETNFFGTLNVIQASLGYFRTRDDGQGGRYLIFSSTSGALGVPGLGPYCATKYAVEGLVESMLYEIDTFNIKATLVEPGHVRRDEPVDATSSPLAAFGHFFIKPASEPYAGPTAPAAHAKRVVQWLGDKQPTSAVKSAELVWQLGHCQFPPLRLLLGSYAVESVRDRLRTIIEEIEDWKYLNFAPPGSEGKKDEDSKNGKGNDDDDAEADGEGEPEDREAGEGEAATDRDGDAKMDVVVKDEDETMHDYSAEEDEHQDDDDDEEHGSYDEKDEEPASKD